MYYLDINIYIIWRSTYLLNYSSNSMTMVLIYLFFFQVCTILKVFFLCCENVFKCNNIKISRFLGTKHFIKMIIEKL